MGFRGTAVALALMVPAVSPAVAQAPEPGVADAVSVAAPTAGVAAYRYFRSADGRPSAYWNPCGVVHYGIDFGYARKVGLRPDWELRRWKSAIAEYASAMGVRFKYVGRMHTRSNGEEPLGGPEMVITYGSQASYPRSLQGVVAGSSGVTWRDGSRRSAEVFRGYVVIDADDIRDRVTAPDPRPAQQRTPDVVRALYMHEFGHAVGLDHVDDRSQLMYPKVISDRADTFGPGDVTALRALGAQRCF